MAMAVTARGAVPIVAPTLQGRIQFGLEHLLDEASNATANRSLQRVEPILTYEWEGTFKVMTLLISDAPIGVHP